MTTFNDLQLTFHEFPNARVSVHRFRGKEGISKLFKFDVECAIESAVLLEALAREATPDAQSRLHPPPPRPPHNIDPRVIGRLAVFTFGDDAATLRQVHGVVSRITRVDRRATVASGEEAGIYSIRLVPHLGARRHEHTSRVFQDLSIPDIVKQVLTTTASAGFIQPVDLELARAHEPREYVVQYRESDHAFVKRILAEEGIHWYFRRTSDSTLPADTSTPSKPVHGDPLDVLVLADGARYPAIREPSPRLARSTRRAPVASRLDAFEPAGRMRPQSVLLRDYDFERPARSIEALVTRASGSTSPISAMGLAAPRAVPLRVYDHDGDYLEADATGERARCRLEQHQGDVFLASGRSTARHLTPGYRVRLAPPEPDVGHPVEEYVVTRVEHRGVAPEHAGAGDEAYTNRFEAVPAHVPFRPKRPERRVAQVLESAVVTGREDGSVYADAHGRIRIQFHWDLAGTMDERSTAWLRVMQGWAGVAFGMQFIPRVGMEVMVSFLGGDPDRPVVLGAVYNRTHPLPFPVGAPDEVGGRASNLRSGIRTASFPGGNGFNELSFEDLAGEEQVYLHAQRDFDAVVRRNQSLSVERCQHVDIGESQTCHVRDRRVERIDGSAERRVGGDETDEIGGNRSVEVDGSDVSSVRKERRARVGADDRLEVDGKRSTWVKGDRFARTDGNAVVVVGSADAPRGCAVRVEGTTDVSVSRMIELSSEVGIRLRCGNSLLEIMPSSIDLLSPTVHMRSSNAEIATKQGAVSVYAKSQATVASGERVELASELGGRLALDAALTGEGRSVHLARPLPGVAATALAQDERTTIVLQDSAGKRLPTRRFVLVLGGGAERSFVTDENGECEVLGLSEEAHIRVPDLTGVAAGGAR